MSQADVDTRFNQAVADKAKQEVADVKGQAQEEIQVAVKNFKEQAESFQANLEKDLKTKFIAVATVVISAVVLALITAMYMATKDVYGAVITLQKDVSSV